jgi:hypothetical protein
MTYLALIDAFVTICMAFWLRALLRARGDDIPCTPQSFSWRMVAIGVVALVGIVIANVLVLKALDSAFGRKLSPLIFTGWLLSMSAAAILFIIAITALHTNRTAVAWIRVLPPDQLSVRVGHETATVRLAPGAVHLVGVAEGVGGLMYVQYAIRNGDRTLDLVVPFTRDAARVTDGAPTLGYVTGVIAQGGARKLHQHLAQSVI